MSVVVVKVKNRKYMLFLCITKKCIEVALFLHDMGLKNHRGCSALGFFLGRLKVYFKRAPRSREKRWSSLCETILRVTQFSQEGRNIFTIKSALYTSSVSGSQYCLLSSLKCSEKKLER